MDPYDVIARYYDRITGSHDADLPLYAALARRTGGPVLEIGAGTGRVAAPLAADGYAVTALEPSGAMLAIGQTRTRTGRLDITWVQQPVEAFRTDDKFALVVCALDSFLHLSADGQQGAALRSVAALLADDGLFALDLPTRASWWDWQPGMRPLELQWSAAGAGPGGSVQHLTTFVAHPVEQVREVTHLFDETGADGVVRRTVASYRLRFIGRAELILLAERAGLRLAEEYGDYDLGPLLPDSERWIALFERDG
jgi:SAM-dependent methyltransferase